MAKKAKAAKAVKAPTKPAKVEVSSDNPYKKGSRKAEIYEVFKRDGLDAATEHAVSLDIKPGTVKSWAGGWTKGQIKPAKKEKTDKPANDEKRGEYHPWFKYTSRERADKGHEELCTRSGLRSHCFHVIEQDGRFAVVPSTFHPKTPTPAFKEGDIVYDAFIANTAAKVIGAGPEQSIIRYLKDRGKGEREPCVINRFLVRVPDEDLAQFEERPSKKLKRAKL